MTRPVIDIADPVHLRSKVALKTRHKGTDHPETIEARRELAEAKLSKYVRQVIADAPPLPAASVERIAALLRDVSEAKTEAAER